MSTETRIGIVAGLLIVVIASVYFFYSSDAEEAEFLVSTDPKVTAPLRIPSSSAEKAGPASPQADKNATPGPPSVASRTPAGKTRRTEPVGGDRIARSDGRKPLRVAPVTRSRDARTRQWRRKQPAPGGPLSPAREPSTALRTGPAPQLIEATRDNIARSGSSPAKSGTDLAAPPERIRPGVQSARDRATAGRRSPPTRSPATGSAAKQRGSRVRPAAERKPPPPASWPKRHKITAGETLSDIALRYYHNSGSFPLILRANPSLKDPRALRIGDIITIPEPQGAAASSSGKRAAPRIAEPSQTVPDLDDLPKQTAASRRTYRVREGDTFYSIARAQCGSSGRWQEVYRLNKDLVKNDPKKLKPDMVIKLP